MNKTIKKALSLIMVSISFLMSSCGMFAKEPKREEKIIQSFMDIPEDVYIIDLKDYFDFEWDEVIIPQSQHEKTVESLMGRHYDLAGDAYAPFYYTD